MSSHPLASLGWSDSLSTHWASRPADGALAGRVIADARERWTVATAAGELTVTLAGRARDASHPVVGDWVAIESRALIVEVLPRSTLLARRAAGAEHAQAVAANVDVVLVCAPLDRPLSRRWLERALALAYTSGASPHVVLTKADACDDPDAARAIAAEAGLACPVSCTSVVGNSGFEELDAIVATPSTFVLIGASGAGKSTLINRWLGEDVLATGAVRDEDHRGRHTTTRRELLFLPTGALVIDTPGVRELGLWAADEGLDAVFSDIEEVAARCRFADCTHAHEPGCAVREAVESGELSAERVEHLADLRREQSWIDSKTDPAAAAARKARAKAISKSVSTVYRLKGR